MWIRKKIAKDREIIEEKIRQEKRKKELEEIKELNEKEIIALSKILEKNESVKLKVISAIEKYEPKIFKSPQHIVAFELILNKQIKCENVLWITDYYKKIMRDYDEASDLNKNEDSEWYYKYQFKRNSRFLEKYEKFSSIDTLYGTYWVLFRKIVIDYYSKIFEDKFDTLFKREDGKYYYQQTCINIFLKSIWDKKDYDMVAKFTCYLMNKGKIRTKNYLLAYDLVYKKLNVKLNQYRTNSEHIKVKEVNNFENGASYTKKDLPVIEAKGLILKNKEVCHYQCIARYQEVKWGEVYSHNGSFYITNKRIMFISDSKTITYPIQSIVQYKFFPDTRLGWALRIYKENQSDNFPILVERAKEIDQIFKVLFNQS